MNVKQSKFLSWISMILMVIVIVVAICTHVVASIWDYSTIFLAFMCIFCHLMSLMLYKMSAAASKKLEILAGIFGILAIIDFIVVFILDWV